MAASALVLALALALALRTSGGSNQLFAISYPTLSFSIPRHNHPTAAAAAAAARYRRTLPCKVINGPFGARRLEGFIGLFSHAFCQIHIQFTFTSLLAEAVCSGHLLISHSEKHHGIPVAHGGRLSPV